MLNKEEIIKHTTNCIKDRQFVYIARQCDQTLKNVRVVLTFINEEEEKQLDDEEVLYLERDGISFTVYPNLCIAYGDLDLSPKSKDIDKLCDSRVFDNLDITHYMLSEYDYNTHTVTSDVKGGRWYDTSNPRTFLPYLYACINKPERVVIFKEYTNTGLKKPKEKASKSSVYNAEQNKLKTEVKRKAKISNMKFTIKK